MVRQGQQRPTTDNRCSPSEQADAGAGCKVTGVVVADVDARVAHQEREEQRQHSHSAVRRDNDETDGERRRRMVAGKRRVGVVRHQEVDRPRMSDERRQAIPEVTQHLVDKQRARRGNECGHGTEPLPSSIPEPPGQKPEGHSSHEERLRELRDADHDMVEQRVAPGPLIHCSSW